MHEGRVWEILTLRRGRPAGGRTKRAGRRDVASPARPAGRSARPPGRANGADGRAGGADSRAGTAAGPAGGAAGWSGGQSGRPMGFPGSRFRSFRADPSSTWIPRSKCPGWLPADVSTPYARSRFGPQPTGRCVHPVRRKMLALDFGGPRTSTARWFTPWRA
eukprot:gene12611-biopygen16947